MKRGFVIILDEKPTRDEEICDAIVKHFEETKEEYNFERTETPIILKVEGRYYDVNLEKVNSKMSLGLWGIRCSEI